MISLCCAPKEEIKPNTAPQGQHLHLQMYSGSLKIPTILEIQCYSSPGLIAETTANVKMQGALLVKENETT